MSSSTDSEYLPESISVSSDETRPYTVADEITELIVDTMDEYNFDFREGIDDCDLRDEVDLMLNHYFHLANN